MSASIVRTNVVIAAAACGVALQLATGCARIQPAPGGPPDRGAPQLLALRPDSMAVLSRFRGEVEFTFDEVIAQGGPGAGANELDRLIILSPSTRPPKVRWRRNRITVEPAEGWQPNRVYRIELLPGLTDLRRNRVDTGAVVTFTTGAPLPRATLTGTVVDWTTRRPVPLALITARLLPDTLQYRGLADSSGVFHLGPLPTGNYVVTGVIDADHDNQQDTREAFDTIRIAAAADTAPTVVGEFWAFEHDSAPPRIASTTVGDSVSATLSFSQMLDPRQKFDPAAARLRRLPDSATVEIASLLPAALDDSLYAKPAPADTAQQDTLRPVPRPEPQQPGPGRRRAALTSRPELFDRLVLRVRKPWQPNDRYVLDIRNVRNVTGKSADVQTVIVVPAPKSPLDSLQKQLVPRVPPKKP